MGGRSFLITNLLAGHITGDVEIEALRAAVIRTPIGQSKLSLLLSSRARVSLSFWGFFFLVGHIVSLSLSGAGKAKK